MRLATSINLPSNCGDPVSHEQKDKKAGCPKTIRVDQGSEFASRDLDLWAYARGVTLDFSRPSKPTDNAFIEAFNGRLRAECLNAHWFLTLADAREKLEDWRKYYDEGRSRGHRQQAPGFAHDSRRRSQLVGVTKGRKTLAPPAVQRWVADHARRDFIIAAGRHLRGRSIAA